MRDFLDDAKEWVLDHLLALMAVAFVLFAGLSLWAIASLHAECDGKPGCPEGLTSRYVDGYGCICVLAPARRGAP